MEKSIGFFGQIKYIIKGIFKPRFFNRLSHQSKGCMISYMIIATIISTAVFWGVSYLVNFVGAGYADEINRVTNQFPDFEYNNGVLNFEDYYIFTSADQKAIIVADSSVAKVSKDYLEDMRIQTDWSVGKKVLVLNTDTFTFISEYGQTSTADYSTLVQIFGFPTHFTKAQTASFINQIVIRVYLIFAGLSLPFFLFKAVATGFVFMGIGFGIVKILKAQYSLKELYNMSVFITGVTTVLKRAITGTGFGIPVWTIDIVFLLIVGVYLFFAITGSAEDVGPTSTIVFNKPSSKKFSSAIDDDPFQKRNYGRNDYKSGAYQSSASAKSNTYTPPVPSNTATVNTSYGYSTNTQTENVTATVETQPVYEEPQTTYAETQPVYEEPQTTYAETQPVYEEPQTTYAETQPVYEETQATYAETQPVYEETQAAYAETQSVYDTSIDNTQATYSEPVEEEQPKPAIIKSEATYGVGYSTTSTGKKKKPKYDRPITAPDSYNGAYYGSTDDDETEESTYFGKSLLENRGGMYGKTLSAFTPSENKSSLISQPANPFEGINLGANVTNITPPPQQTTFGGSLYVGSPSTGSSSSSGLNFTTKSGAEPFAYQKRGFASEDSFNSLGNKKSNSNNVTTYKKNGVTKKINRYSPDDFAAWEREAYADEFSKPIGGFGR